jgi:putative ATP-dependent endonuclease of OLD family
VIITDGDAEPSAAGRTDAGLKRGAALAPSLRRKAIVDSIRELPNQTDDTYTGKRTDVVSRLQEHDIFVGAETLETDLCSVFPDEMISAFNELGASANARRDVRDGVLNEAATHPDTDARSKMMKRIDRVGKGRFAQRLADHIAQIDLRTRVAEIIGSGDPDAIEGEDLNELGAAAYLFQALNAVSVEMRGTALFQDSNDDPDSAGA